jgi:hypothetical protein
MVTLYHGSPNLFDKPDFSRVAKTEYGHGFYGSDYGGDCWEYLQGRIASGEPAYIYKFEIPDKVMEERWLHSNLPASGPKTDRILAALRADGENELADRIEKDPRRHFDPTRPRDDEKRFTERDLYYSVGKSKQDQAFWERAGIDGYHEGNYFVNFEHGFRSGLNVQQVWNTTKEEAEAGLLTLKTARAVRERREAAATELASERHQKVGSISAFHGTAMIGVDKAGQHYSVYDPDEDHNRGSAQDRISLKFGQDREGVWRVREITRDGQRAERAYAAQSLSNDDPAAKERLIDSIFRPDHATIAGVRFELGGPAEGRIASDAEFARPDSQKALAKMADNYDIAAFHRINFGQPQVIAPAAAAEPPRPRIPA